MKENSTSQVKIRHLRPNEKAYVVDCLAHDLKVKETVANFKERFPDFGRAVDPDTRNHILAKRISDIKRKNVMKSNRASKFPRTPSRISQ